MFYLLGFIIIIIFYIFIWNFVSTYEETMSKIRKLENEDDDNDVIFK
jgi:hypothetical protein